MKCERKRPAATATMAITIYVIKQNKLLVSCCMVVNVCGHFISHWLFGIAIWFSYRIFCHLADDVRLLLTLFRNCSWDASWTAILATNLWTLFSPTVPCDVFAVNENEYWAQLQLRIYWKQKIIRWLGIIVWIFFFLLFLSPKIDQSRGITVRDSTPGSLAPPRLKVYIDLSKNFVQKQRKMIFRRILKSTFHDDVMMTKMILWNG